MHIFTWRQTPTGIQADSFEVPAAEAPGQNFEPRKFRSSLSATHGNRAWLFGTDKGMPDEFLEYAVHIDSGVAKIYAYDNELIEVFASGAWSQLRPSRYVTEILR